MMHLDEKTGLLYIEEVPFTLDHLRSEERRVGKEC